MNRTVRAIWGGINCRHWGNQDSQVKLLLAHGKDDAAGCFAKTVERLPSDWHVVGIDFPGHGLSDHPQNQVGDTN